MSSLVTSILVLIIILLGSIMVFHNPVNKLGKESGKVLFHRVNFCTQGVVNPTVLSISKLID